MVVPGSRRTAQPAHFRSGYAHVSKTTTKRVNGMVTSQLTSPSPLEPDDFLLDWRVDRRTVVGHHDVYLQSDSKLALQIDPRFDRKRDSGHDESGVMCFKVIETDPSGSVNFLRSEIMAGPMRELVAETGQANQVAHPAVDLPAAQCPPLLGRLGDHFDRVVARCFHNREH